MSSQLNISAKHQEALINAIKANGGIDQFSGKEIISFATLYYGRDVATDLLKMRTSDDKNFLIATFKADYFGDISRQNELALALKKLKEQAFVKVNKKLHVKEQKKPYYIKETAKSPSTPKQNKEKKKKTLLNLNNINEK